MEIELKYSISEPSLIDKIFKDDHILRIEDEDTYEELPMKAIYFDTVDSVLSKNGFTFRTRQEGDNQIATIKWGGETIEGMHRRNELNIPIFDEAFINNPSVEIFVGAEIEEKLKTLIGEKKLLPIMNIEFLRKQVRIDTGKSISVLSTDLGKVMVGEKEAPICELEIELYSGDEEDMKELGKEISSKYNLIPEDVSKFQRGLALIRAV